MNKQQKIAELKAQISELEKITPEQRFLDLIDGMIVKIDKEKYPDSTFFFNGDKCFFELEKSTLWVRYAEVWQVFNVEFGMGYSEIQSFIKNQVEQHFKMMGVTPNAFEEFPWYTVEQHFKMMGITHAGGRCDKSKGMEQHFKMRG